MSRASPSASGGLSLIVQLALTDARSIGREALLLFLFALPVILAVLYRYALPGLEAQLQERLDFALAPYHPLLMALFIGMSPTLIGGVYGLLLVDERDERTLPALRVTPVPFAGYLAARLALPTLFALLITTAAYPVSGLVPLPLGTVALLALAAASFAPVAALAIVTFAPNKLTGLVVFRLLNTGAALPALVFLRPDSWAMVAWPLPPYWPMAALWRADAGLPFAGPLVLAVALNGGLVFALYRWFDRSRTV